MNAQPVTVLLADDHTMVREGFASLISKNPKVQVIGHCEDGLKVVQQVKEIQPDVVVQDIFMPGMNGLDICRELSKKFPKTKVLMLTMHDTQEFIIQALESGACGYVTKDAPPDQLIEAILAVARGEKFVGEKITPEIIDRVGKDDGDPYKKLTTRERQVLQLIAEGNTSRQIASILEISEKTVDTHRSHLMRKLGFHDQTELVKFAIRKGIVGLD
jgi:DNA-binding NarL/FixJ family response regulator